MRLGFGPYHAHRITGDVPGTWDRVRPEVVHVQVAGYEGRHEPDDPGFFDRLDADGYRGWVSAEYVPCSRTEEGLGWLKGRGRKP